MALSSAQAERWILLNSPRRSHHSATRARCRSRRCVDAPPALRLSLSPSRNYGCFLPIASLSVATRCPYDLVPPPDNWGWRRGGLGDIVSQQPRNWGKLPSIGSWFLCQDFPTTAVTRSHPLLIVGRALPPCMAPSRYPAPLSTSQYNG